MACRTAEQFAQHALYLNLLDARQLDAIWGEFGTRSVPLADFQRFLLRRELMTNYQIDRLLRGERSGFFYGQYRVLYLIGTGSFARVFRAQHEEDGKVLAVKALRRRYNDVPTQTEQFLREGRMGMTLRHPNIVPIFEVGIHERSHYLVMDFVEGRNLREFLRVRKKLQPAEAARLMTHVMAGLTYAHTQGVTHRDLKLSNVLVAATGEARLVDFGLAAVAEKMSDEALANCPNPRTIDYAGLERATGVRKDDPRSDIYFAGCILYHMLTGEAPLFETKDRLQRLSITRFQQVTPILQLEPLLPHRLVVIVNRAMELNPNRRYENPGQMLADLQHTTQWLAQQAGEDHEPGGGGAGETARRATRTLLVVEPNVALQNVLREQLKKLGHRVLVMSDAQLAIGRFEAGEDVADCVVFSGSREPSLTLEAFNLFGKMPTTRNVPAILLLNESQPEVQDQAQLADHRVVVPLPIRMKQFAALLDKMLHAAPSSSSP